MRHSLNTLMKLVLIWPTRGHCDSHKCINILFIFPLCPVYFILIDIIVILQRKQKNPLNHGYQVRKKITNKKIV